MTGSSPQMTLSATITAYNRVLLDMPEALCMTQSSLRRHLVWKRMLAASDDGQIKFSELTPYDAGHMCSDGDEANIPSWLSVGRLAAQLKCPPGLLFMWASLWRDALELKGAAAAIFQKTAGMRLMLNQYLGSHSHPPSPRSLLQHHLQIAGDADAGISCTAKLRSVPPRHPPRLTPRPAKRANSGPHSQPSIGSCRRRAGSAR